jgi:hypothetical protein
LEFWNWEIGKLQFQNLPISQFQNFSLSLALLIARVLLVDHKQLSFPLHDLTIGAAFFDGSSDFHCLVFGLLAVGRWLLAFGF